MIATWPNIIKKKTKTNHISAFHDFYATVCDILGIEKPKAVNG